MREELPKFTTDPKRDFTRNRKLPFETLCRTILSMSGQSLNVELQRQFHYDPTAATTAAFVQQRGKLLPTAFDEILRRFTYQNRPILRWNGYTLLAADGSHVQIPSDIHDEASSNKEIRTVVTADGVTEMEDKGKPAFSFRSRQNSYVIGVIHMENRIFGYARVSTKEQNLDRQLLALAEQSIQEMDIIVDKEGGKDLDRKGYRLLKDGLLRRSDTLVVTSLDRLSRSKSDIKQELEHFKAGGIRLKVLDLPTTMLDFPEGQEWIQEMVNNILIEVLSTMAEQARITIRRRQAEGCEATELGRGDRGLEGREDHGHEGHAADRHEAHHVLQAGEIR